MKLLLLSDVYKQGVAGEVVDVANGYGRNYLIPKKLAVKATAGELKKAEGLRATAAARKAELEDRLNDLARQIDGVELVFGRRAANTGKLFGSVTTSDLAEALQKKTGIDINRRRISQQALREIGTFHVPVRLGSEMSPVLKIVVIREADMADYLAGLKAAPPVIESEYAPEVTEEEPETVAEAVAEAPEETVEPAGE